MTRAAKASVTTAVATAAFATAGAVFLLDRGGSSIGSAQAGLRLAGSPGAFHGGTSGSDGAAFAEFTQCLRTHGVNIAARGGDGRPEIAGPKARAAMETCREYAPAGPPPQGGGRLGRPVSPRP